MLIYISGYYQQQFIHASQIRYVVTNSRLTTSALCLYKTRLSYIDIGLNCYKKSSIIALESNPLIFLNTSLLLIERL